MKQVTQRLKDGRIELREVPPPEIDEHSVLVQVRASVLSPEQSARKSRRRATV